mgnify:CR=1 FL=1|jgi:hypothetical protein
MGRFRRGGGGFKAGKKKGMWTGVIIAVGVLFFYGQKVVDYIEEFKKPKDPK